MFYSRFYAALAVTLSIYLLNTTVVFAQDDLETKFPAPAFAMNDFDGDGTADIAIFQNQADGSPNELVYTHRESSSGLIPTPVEFGRSTDIPALGDYDGDTVTDYVVVREEDGSLSWITRVEDGADTSISFGLTDDFVLSGCDLDDDGEVDPAIFRTGEGIYYLNDSDEQVLISISLREGELPTLMTCADFDNDDTREVVFLLNSDSYRLAVYSNTGEELYSVATKDLTNLFVYDANGDGVLDIGAYRKRKRRAWIFNYIQGDDFQFEFQRRRLRGGKRTNSAIGLYDGEQDSWSILFYGRRGRFFTLNESSGRVLRSSFQAINGDSLLMPQNLESTGTSPIDDPDGRCSSIEDMSDGPNGRLWKAAEHGGTVALFPQCDYRARSVRIFHRGNLLYNMEDTGDANADQCGLRRHFRARDRNPGSFPSGIILEVTSTRGAVFCYQINGSTGRRVD